MPAGASSPLTRAFLADPVTVTTMQYRPLPSHAALGLSAFYIAVLTLMCGFLAGVIVNASVDAALGYATTEIGPRWRQRQPLPINRWHTLLIKLVMAVVLTGLMTGLMLLVAAGIFRMNAPNAGLLWLLAWLCSVSVASGTLVLFAILGASIGQLLAMLIFVYVGFAASGGTVPLQALPSGLPWLAAGAGFWLVVGTVVVRWYDRKGFHRMSPEMLAYVSSPVQQYRAQKADARQQDSGTAGKQTEPGAQA